MASLEELIGRANEARKSAGQAGQGGEAPWMQYLRDYNTSVLSSPATERFQDNASMKAQATQYERNVTISQAAGLPTQTEKKGFLEARVLPIFRFTGAVGASLTKELSDLVDLSTRPWDNDAKIKYSDNEFSLTDLRDQIRDRVQFTDLPAYQFLSRNIEQAQAAPAGTKIPTGIKALDKVLDGGIAAEDIVTPAKVARGIVGVGGSIVADPTSFVGFGVGGALSRKALAESTALASKNAAVKSSLLVQGAAESAEQYAKRVQTFGNQAGDAVVTNRAAGVRKLFEETAEKQGLDRVAGTQAFLDFMPKQLQGGVGLLLGSAKFGAINRGGVLTEKLGLSRATTPVVEAFQSAKNAARAGAGGVFDTKIGGAVAQLWNKPLNNIGKESAAWSDYMKKIATSEVDASARTTFGAYMAAKAFLNDSDNALLEVTSPFHGRLLDLARIQKERPDLYKAASDIAQGNPNVVLTGIDADAATELATLMRGTFDDVFEMMRVNGIDLQYAEDYFPLLYSKAGKEQREAARLLTAGAQGVRGKGYDPTKTRTAFFKDKLDENGAPILDKFGQKIRVQMAPYEIKQELVRLGLPDDIETDILTLINRQVLAAGKMVAGKRLADDLINKGALTPGGVQQFAIPETTRKLIAENLNPNAVAAGVADVFTTPANLSAYLRTLDANNPEDVAKVSDMLGAVAQAIGPRQTKTGAKKMKLTQEEYESARAAFAQAKRISQTPTSAVAPELTGRGLVQVGEDRIGYLPEQYAGMFGDKALVDMVNRYLFPEYNIGELEATARALMQSFKTFATFGRGTGFVARNGLGAAQQNFLGGVSALPRSGYKTGDYGPAAAITAASARADYYMGKLSKIVSTDPKTDKIVSLVPTSRGAAGGKLSRSPQIVTVNGLIDKMVKENVVDATTATAMKADLDQFGIIRQDTISGAHDAIIRRSLDALPDYEGIPLTTIYETSVKSGVVDPTKIMGEILQGPVDDAVFSKLIRGSDRVDLRPDKAQSDKGLITKAANRAVNLAPIRYNRQFNNRVEQEVRTAAITAGLRMFGNDETGQEIANAFMKGLHFDYSNLTDVEKRYMQMVMPFWTWTKNNIPLQFRNLMLNPGRANKIMETNEGVESVFADDSGDIYYMPSWLKESFGFVTGSSPAGYPLVVRLESPLVDINKFFHGEGAPVDTKEFLSGANPLAKSLIQWQAGTNLYTGASYPKEGVEAPEWYKSMLKIPGLEGLLPSNRKKDGTILMPGALRDGIKDNIPTIGLLERLGTPGFTSPEQKERAASNLPSIILGAPLATLTPQQETGELISRNEGLRANINDWAGRNGVDLDALRRTVNSGQYTSEELAQLLAQGYFLNSAQE